MDLDTSTLVAKVNTQSLLDISLNGGQSTNFVESSDLPFESSNGNEFENEDCDLDKEDFIISSTEINRSSKSIKRNNSTSDTSVDLPHTQSCDSSFKKIHFNDTDFLNAQSEYPFTACNIALNQYCETEVSDLIDDTSLNGKDYNDDLLSTNESATGSNAFKYQHLVNSVTSTSTEFISPETILEENSELVDPQDQADYNAFNEFLNIPLTGAEDIEPHFIAGNFSDSDKQDTKENRIDTSDMGIENTWNEEFAVPSTSSFPLPLPAPPENGNFNDFSSCNNFDSVEHGPYTSDLEALFSTNEAGTDISDVAADEGVCGLRNLGNTCFMSAGIQCLVATKSLVHFYRKLLVGDLDESSLTMQFTELLQKIWSGQYSVVHPMKFKQALGVYYPQFKDCSQHDCQEFLALLLDALHQQLVTMPKEIYEVDNYSCKDKIDNDVNMKVEIDCLSSTIPSTKCDTLYDYVNNRNEITSSMPLFDENNSVIHFTKNNNKDIENSEMSVVNSFCHVSNVKKFLDDQSTNMENESEDSVTGNKLNYIEDILKETKTSNVNVLVTETEANNEICFDSEKFPKKERRRNIAETNYYDIYSNDTNTIQKDAGFCFNSEENLNDNVDLKRIKVNHLSKEKNCLMEDQNQHLEKNVRLENERNIKVLNVDMKQSNTEENAMEMESSIDENGEDTEEKEMRVEDDNEEVTSQMSEDLQSNDDMEAEKHWEKHVFNNRSVIFDSFQGQFKNTVVCSACNFKSITYEPFMYLSVPLPHAIEKQICVTFIPANANPPVQYLITLTKQDEVSKIKQHLRNLITEELEHPIVIGEVLEYHITKILDDNHQIRYLDDINRSIYAFEQLLVFRETKDESAAKLYDDHLSRNDRDNANFVNEACAICLDEKESDVKRHKDCACILCDVCIVNYTLHFGKKNFQCPVCRADIPEEDLVPIEQSDIKPNLRLLNVPLVYRIDKTGEGNNNQKKIKLFGHPALLKLPNQIDSEELYEIVSSMHSYTEPFKLLLVDGQGRHCSRCMFNQHCKGCVIPRNGHVTLRSNDTLAVTFTEDVKEICEIRHQSMALQRTHKTLSLYDCVQAFSQSEILDEFNPWYCPRCEKNQCATKTLSVWRFPNYLIVYLKRFVFHECTSIKLEDKVMFPLHGFNFNKKNESPYDLYACVCHTGGVSVGHYIAYTQHPVTSEWHCFNDENVSKQKPQEEEYCNAYILFYKKRDANDNVQG